MAQPFGYTLVIMLSFLQTVCTAGTSVLYSWLTFRKKTFSNLNYRAYLFLKKTGFKTDGNAEVNVSDPLDFPFQKRRKLNFVC